MPFNLVNLEKDQERQKSVKKDEKIFGWFSTRLTIVLPLTTTYRTAALKMALCTLLNPRTYSKKLCFSSCASQARKYFSLLSSFFKANCGLLSIEKKYEYDNRVFQNQVLKINKYRN